MLYFCANRGGMMQADLTEVKNLPEYAKNVQIIIICMFIGVVAAALISLYHKLVLGSFIRFLLDSGAVDEETAILLNSTKYDKNVFVRSAIKNGRTYAGVLRSVPPEGADSGVKLTRKRQNELLSATSFYIPAELSFRADNIFSKRGTSIGSAVFGILLFVLVAAVCLLIVPQIVSMMETLFGI